MDPSNLSRCFYRGLCLSNSSFNFNTDHVNESIDKVKEIYSYYLDGISNLPFLKLIQVNIEAGEVPIYIEVLYEDRECLIQFLANRGIESRSFYPDLNLASYFENNGHFPNSKIYGQQGVYLPSGPGQDIESIKKVIEALKVFFK